MFKRIMRTALCVVMVLATVLLGGCSANRDETMAVRLLLLPHFEIDDMAGDFPGEAQLFYEEYLTGAEEYTLANGSVFYYEPEKQIAMVLTGSGKAATAENLTCALSDSRFDFSQAYLLAVGCAGGAVEYSTLGDVCIAVGACDYDLGHMADSQDLTVESNTQLWYHEASFDENASRSFNTELVEQAYSLVKEETLETTDIARATMNRNFPGEEWAERDPQVILGVCLTGDDYWKGIRHHETAKEIVEFYLPGESYAMTEMEDVAIAVVADHFGLLDRCLVLRVNVNPDVFIDGNSPESLWSADFAFNNSVDVDNQETLDIFEPAMRNLFKVGQIIIDSLLLQ